MNTTFLPDRFSDAKELLFETPVAARSVKQPAASRILVQNEPDGARELSDLKRGLLDAAARIDPKFFYDPVGCALFSSICTLPEYYLTRTEAAIFECHGSEILRYLPPRVQWIDLGCGSCAKSEPWIRVTMAERFVGVDIAREWLDQALRRIAAQFPDVECIGVVADFSEALAIREIAGERPELSPVFFYPGSSLGNFSPAGALTFLRSVRSQLDSGGCLLIGVDLVKDVRILEAAYDDAHGVTAAFNRNALRVVNRLLDADFDPGHFEHVACFNHEESRIEMRLRSAVSQQVTIGADTREFAEGECILTEYSHKYTLGGFAKLLSAAGFTRQKAWTDPAGWFAVFLARP